MEPMTPTATSGNTLEPRTTARAVPAPARTPASSQARSKGLQFSWSRHAPWAVAGALVAGGLYLGAVALLGWVWGSIAFGGAGAAVAGAAGRAYRSRRKRRAGGPLSVLGARPGSRRAGLFGKGGAGPGGRGGRLFSGLRGGKATGPGGARAGRRGLQMPWSKNRTGGPRAGGRTGRTGGLLGRLPGTKAWKANRAARRRAGTSGRSGAGPGRAPGAGGGRSLRNLFGGGKGRSKAGTSTGPRAGTSRSGRAGGAGSKAGGGPARFFPGTAAYKARVAAKKANRAARRAGGASASGTSGAAGKGRSATSPAEAGKKRRWWSKKEYGGLGHPDGPQAGRRRRSARDLDPGRPHLLAPKRGWWESRRDEKRTRKAHDKLRREQAAAAGAASTAAPRRSEPSRLERQPEAAPPPRRPPAAPAPQTRPRDPRGQDAQPQRPGGQKNMAHEIEAPQVKGAAAMQDAGLYAALLNLAPAGEEVRAQARKFRGLASQMAEEQPAHPAVAEALAGMATMLETAAGLGDGLWPEARQKHEKDFERAEQPRGGNVGIERKADVGRAADEGAI